MIVCNLDDELVVRLLREVLTTEPRRSFRELAAKVRAMTAGRPHTLPRRCCAKDAMNGDLRLGERLVIDASVAVKWVVPEPGSNRAEAKSRRHRATDYC